MGELCEILDLKKKLLRLMEDLVLLNNLEFFSNLDSTNLKASILEKNGACNGTVVFAAQQQKGKGRLSRSWVSGKEDITLSFILRPPFLPKNISLLPMIVALAACDALRELSLPAFIKWPNDVVLKGQHGTNPQKYCGNYFKVGGILIENVIKPEGISASIIGMGLNVRPNDELKSNVPHATCINDFAPQINRFQCLERLLWKMENKIFWAQRKSHTDVVLEYKNRCISIGKNVTLTTTNGMVRGLVTDVLPSGALLIRDKKQNHEIFCGDIQLSNI